MAKNDLYLKIPTGDTENFLEALTKSANKGWKQISREELGLDPGKPAIAWFDCSKTYERPRARVQLNREDDETVSVPSITPIDQDLPLSDIQYNRVLADFRMQVIEPAGFEADE